MEEEITEDLIRSVVNTYNLSEVAKAKLTGFLFFRIKDIGIQSFDEVYSYIDKFAFDSELMQPSRPRSLDKDILEGTRTLHDIVGKEDSFTKDILNTNPPRNISGEEVLNYLSGAVDKQDVRVLSELIADSDIEFEVSPEYLLRNAEEISRRTREVSQRYEKNGIVLLPKRPIVSISFNPFDVQFKKGHLTDEEKAVLVKSYSEFNGNAAAVARHLGYDTSTVLRHWKSADLETRSSGSLLTPEVNEIISLHEAFNGNVTRAAESSSYSQPTISKYWRKKGLKVQPQGWPSHHDYNSLPKNKKLEIISLHSVFKGNATRTAKFLGCSANTILKYWKQNGLETRRSGIRDAALNP